MCWLSGYVSLYFTIYTTGITMKTYWLLIPIKSNEDLVVLVIFLGLFLMAIVAVCTQFFLTILSKKKSGRSNFEKYKYNIRDNITYNRGIGFLLIYQSNY